MVTPIPDPRTGTYGQAYHEAQVDRLAHELAEALETWFNRDRESDRAYYLASRITNIARALSSETHALGRVRDREAAL